MTLPANISVKLTGFSGGRADGARSTTCGASLNGSCARAATASSGGQKDSIAVHSVLRKETQKHFDNTQSKSVEQ